MWQDAGQLNTFGIMHYGQQGAGSQEVGRMDRSLTRQSEAGNRTPTATADSQESS